MRSYGIFSHDDEKSSLTLYERCNLPFVLDEREGDGDATCGLAFAALKLQKTERLESTATYAVTLGDLLHVTVVGNEDCVVSLGDGANYGIGGACYDPAVVEVDNFVPRMLQRPSHGSGYALVEEKPETDSRAHATLRAPEYLFTASMSAFVRDGYSVMICSSVKPSSM
jgi:hypothetical protein